MIFIVVKFNVKPEWSERWLDLVADFTKATREEPGNLWFDWSRSVDNPNEFVLVEAFQDDAAEAHVNSDHFKKAMADMPQALVETPHIISRQFEGSGWDRMGEHTLASGENPKAVPGSLSPAPPLRTTQNIQGISAWPKSLNEPKRPALNASTSPSRSRQVVTWPKKTW